MKAASNSTEPTALEASFFERLFDGAGLAILACDPRGRVVAWSAIARELFAERVSGAARTAARELLPEDDRAIFDENFKACIERNEPAEFRTRFAGVNKSPTDYAVWITPHQQGAAVWFHDITVRMELRRGVRKHERLTVLGALSGAVAHHYNNLLCSIATSLEYAINMNTMSAMRRALRRTADAAARATRLTHQLLAFAQADYRAGDEADLTETVLYYFDENESRFNERGVTLDVDWKRSAALPVPREHLVIVLNNLVENSLDAMPDGGTLTVRLAPRGETHVCLSIADTGGGIPPDVLEHLFEPFHTTRGALLSGAGRREGMGLAVVYGLIAEMYGTVSAVNVPGGARFEVVLPTARGTATESDAG